MFEDPRGPITHFSWGKFIINGQEHSKVACSADPAKKEYTKIGLGCDIRIIGSEVTKWRKE